MIPRILTQTWKSTALPPAAAKLREEWISRNPDFDCRLFDDDACDALLADTFPEHLDAYRSLPFAVMRADIFRYAAVFRDGGFYADIDMECLKPLGALSGSASCLLAVEAHLGRRRAAELGYPRPFQIANCVFAAAPRHPFLLAAMRRAFALVARNAAVGREAIEDITGPRMLTRLFFERIWTDVAVTPQIVLMAPLCYPNLWPLNRSMLARHRTFGTWKDKERSPSPLRRWTERSRLPHPFPPALTVPAASLVSA